MTHCVSAMRSPFNNGTILTIVDKHGLPSSRIRFTSDEVALSPSIRMQGRGRFDAEGSQCSLYILLVCTLQPQYAMGPAPGHWKVKIQQSRLSMHMLPRNIMSQGPSPSMLSFIEESMRSKAGSSQLQLHPQ